MKIEGKVMQLVARSKQKQLKKEQKLKRLMSRHGS